MLTGSGRSVAVPSPSWPALLLPQHLTADGFNTAHVWAPPAATLITPLARPVTSTGTGLNAPADGAPNWPRLLSPQHLTPPAAVTMHVCWVPTAIVAAPASVAMTRLPTATPNISISNGAYL